MVFIFHALRLGIVRILFISRLWTPFFVPSLFLMRIIRVVQVWASKEGITRRSVGGHPGSVYRPGNGGYRWSGAKTKGEIEWQEDQHTTSTVNDIDPCKCTYSSPPLSSPAPKSLSHECKAITLNRVRLVISDATGIKAISALSFLTVFCRFSTCLAKVTTPYLRLPHRLLLAQIPHCASGVITNALNENGSLVSVWPWSSL